MIGAGKWEEEEEEGGGVGEVTEEERVTCVS